LRLELDDAAREFLLEKGTDEKFGARPLRRTISNLIEDPLSEDLLRNKYEGKNLIRVTVETNPENEDDKKIKFEGAQQTEGAENEPAVAGADAT
jgi:ATP-dependent Clp protease ATP-binding subunit ClpC